MSELYDSIPAPQRKAYEALAAEAAEQASEPVIKEIGQHLVEDATRLTIVAGIVDAIDRGENPDSKRILHDMPKQRFEMKPIHKRFGHER